jgi:hypothetical protein
VKASPVRLESRIFFSRFARRRIVFAQTRFVSETRRLGDDTIVTGGLTRGDIRLMIVQPCLTSTHAPERRRAFPTRPLFLSVYSKVSPDADARRPKKKKISRKKLTSPRAARIRADAPAVFAGAR